MTDGPSKREIARRQGGPAPTLNDMDQNELAQRRSALKRELDAIETILTLRKWRADPPPVDLDKA